MEPHSSTTEEKELKVKIISEKLNPLLKRKEVDFTLEHSEEGQTSSRLEIKQNLANTLKTKPDLVFIEKVETKTGTTIAQGEANIYESTEQAKFVEREHIINRNVLPVKEEIKEKPEEPEGTKEEAKEVPKEMPKKETKEKDSDAGAEEEIKTKEKTEVKTPEEKGEEQ